MMILNVKNKKRMKGNRLVMRVSSTCRKRQENTSKQTQGLHVAYRFTKGFSVALDEEDVFLVLGNRGVTCACEGLYSRFLCGPVVLCLWWGEDIVEVIVVEVSRGC